MRNLVLIAVTAAAALAAAPIDKKDVEYGRPGGHALLLDLHIPDGPGPFPAAILVHGGGFDGGSKSTNCKPLFEPLANANIAWFSIDYRMAPEFRFPEAKEDMAIAIRWVKGQRPRIPRGCLKDRDYRRKRRRILGQLRRDAPNT